LTRISRNDIVNTVYDSAHTRGEFGTISKENTVENTDRILMENKNGYVVVDGGTLEGRCDEFLAAIENSPMVKENKYRVVLDLKSVEYLNSVYLTILVRLKKRIDEKNGSVYLVNVSEKNDSLLDKLQLNAVFSIFRTYSQFSEFQSTVKNNATGDCIKLTRNITVSTVDDIRTPMKKLLETDIKNITLDLAEVKIIDSIGVGELIRSAKTLKSRTGSIILINVNKDIGDFLRVLHLDRFITIKQIEG
jgi:anti-anti-sigma factor